MFSVDSINLWLALERERRQRPTRLPRGGTDDSMTTELSSTTLIASGAALIVSDSLLLPS